MSEPRLFVEIPGGAISAVLLAVLLAGLVVLALRPAELPASPPRRRWLSILRVGTAILAWLLAVQPALSSERIEHQPGRLAVLFDASRSGIVRGADGRPRVEQARALAARWASADHESEPDVYTYGAALRPARLSTLGRGLEATEDDTRLGTALEAAVGSAPELGAAIVVSDGAERGPSALEAAEHLGLRVYGVALGTGAALRDDAIARVEADPVAFLRRPSTVRITLRRLGAPAGPIPVALLRGEETVREASVIVPEDGEASLELSFSPERLGRALYRIRIPAAPGDGVPENDERAFLVNVARDDLRVLLVAGQPSWDERFLRAFLSREATTDLISFFILRNTSDMTMAQPDELALIPFPTDELFREHLGSFDVVLFQNFEYAPYQMAQYLPRIRDYVVRGGSFAMIGGPLSFSAAGYAETALAEILPVGVLPRGTPAATATTTDRFSPVLADDAVRHPILALLPEPRANVEAWARLAPLEGLNVTSEVRGGGHVLLQHPSRRARSGGPLPVLVTGTAGRGRVLALMTDTSWRWGLTTGGLSGDDSAYERFWDRAVRWLARDPSLEPARVTTDRESYGPGARVRVEASLADERYQPLSGRSIVLSIAGDTGVLAEATVRADGEGRATAELDGPPTPGGYRVLATPEGEAEPLATEVFVVEAGGEELADPRPHPERLRELAERTGGAFWDDPSAAPDLDTLDRSRARSLGIATDRPFATGLAFGIFALAFGAEWVVRRRWGAR